ncbi:MOSC domain-containing protein [Pasteurellaceae bacterium 15-036681]|nr:MOSC domain-containing protein [Pasteurellaceae bacterium 15-036681]
MKITQLNLYPIKSTQVYRVNQALVNLQGLNFDREFMLTEPDGTFITARKDKALYQLAAFPVTNGIVIVHDNGEQYVVRYTDFEKLESSEVWGTYFDSFVAKDEVNQWLSQFFGRTVQLRWLGEQSQRNVKDFEHNPMSFGDSNPLLLVSEKSLQQVQKWAPVPISMEQFRGNIVIDGAEPFEEEKWQQIRIGQVKFTVAQSCTRCILITRNLETLELDPQAEPLRTLKQQHTNEQGKPIFGIHLVPENSGIIRVGDSINILK